MTCEQQLVEAREQIDKLLRSKAAAEREMNKAIHDLNGIICCLSGNRHLLEIHGIPVPQLTGRHKDDAVILLNTACAAATGKIYEPYEQQREKDKELKELKQKLKEITNAKNPD